MRRDVVYKLLWFPAGVRGRLSFRLYFCARDQILGGSRMRSLLNYLSPARDPQLDDAPRTLFAVGGATIAEHATRGHLNIGGRPNIYIGISFGPFSSASTFP
ncbi:hypothetical protein GWI33_012394 [Rhynchophorus ferrugineus]|uniref:Uncharacterized protein n=1 Tax=Rhynchophorus ferrugineus TaxID=354439 RepID=A0A834IBG6_RHYFE|nr:hypothetical protein GWI33_012394 [Rhynchophorus ferrugineus]